MDASASKPSKSSDSEGAGRVIVDRAARPLKETRADSAEALVDLLREGKSDKSQKYASGFEEFVKRLLDEAGIGSTYAQLKFWIHTPETAVTKEQGGGPERESAKFHENSYTPDFITDLKIGSRVVVIEPHGFGNSGLRDARGAMAEKKKAMDDAQHDMEQPSKRKQRNKHERKHLVRRYEGAKRAYEEAEARYAKSINGTRESFGDQLVKYSRFMERYGDRWYLVMITDMSKEELLKLAQEKGIKGPIASDIWYNGEYHRADLANNNDKQSARFIRAKFEQLKFISEALRMQGAGRGEKRPALEKMTKALRTEK